MARTYEVNQNADVAEFVRVLARDGAGTPTSGLTISFILRDETGAVLDSGSLDEVDGATAPGWYQPPALILPASGTYTFEFTPPALHTLDSDSAVILVPDNSPVRDQVRDTAIIGENYRFNVLFTDRDNAPLSVTAPSIEIYRFDSATGDRVTVVAAGTPLSAQVPASTGRYVYLHLVDATLTENDKLFAEVQGADPTPGGVGLIRMDYILELQARRVPGLGHSFIDS